METSINTVASHAAVTASGVPGESPYAWLYVLSWGLAEIGGVNEVVRNMFDRTERRLRHRPLLLVREWGQKQPSIRVQEARTTISFEIRSPWDPQHRLGNLLRYCAGLPRVLRQLVALVRQQRIDTVHLHYPDLHALTWLLLRTLLQRQMRLVLSFHGLDLKSALSARGLERVAWGIVLRSVDLIVVCSLQLRERLTAAYPGSEARIRVIDNGVDVHCLEAARLSEPAVPLPTSFVVSIGTYEHKKGHDVLMRAFELAFSRLPHMGLVILGRYGEQEYEKLTRLKESLLCRERIILLKDVPHPEAMRILARAEIFALASREEPFGIVILEAAVLSRPVIATDVCGAALLFVAGTDLLRVPANDIEALAEALVRLLGDGNLSRNLARNLRARVVAEFDWERVMDRYAEQLLLPQPGLQFGRGSP